jgi:diamine N-acetyltransferase
MVIRKAKENEVEKLQTLNDEVFIDNAKYDSDLDMDWAKSEKGKKYFTELVNDPEGCCLLVEEDGKLVGYIAARQKKIDYRKSSYIEIENMGVIPEYRSKGIGSELIRKCLVWAKEHGFQKVYVSAYFHNSKAVEFYKRNGFSEIDMCFERAV